MDYKEKYEMALSRAKNLHKDAIDMGETLRAKQCEIIFPELAESEDEKIRKEIISALKNANYKGVYDKHLAWLEKQGGKDKLIQELGDYKVKYTQKVLGQYLENQGEKPINDTDEEIVEAVQNTSVLDMVEPRFKAGDWITDGQLTCKVLSVTSKSYELHLYNDDYCHFETDVQSIDKQYHLWTIQDAKDGDLLATWAGAFIYNGNNGGGSCPGSYCGINTLGSFQTGFEHHWTVKKVYPATKEQRDLLFKKMIEAGYEWDSEKKELKKMTVTASTYCSENCKGYQETGKCFADGECDAKRKYDNMLDSCEIEHIEDGKYYYCIKDYYAGGNKRASKGDVVQAKRGMSMMALGSKANEYFLPVYQMPNQEWSEEMYKMAFSNCHL